MPKTNKSTPLWGDLDEESKKKYMFYHLVKGEKDAAGMIAYAIYKNSKIDYIKSYQTREGREPSQEELKKFQEDHCTGQVIKGYKMQGVELLKAFQAKFIDLNEILVNSKEEEINKRERILKS